MRRQMRFNYFVNKRNESRAFISLLSVWRKSVLRYRKESCVRERYIKLPTNTDSLKNVEIAFFLTKTVGILCSNFFRDIFSLHFENFFQISVHQGCLIERLSQALDILPKIAFIKLSALRGQFFWIQEFCFINCIWQCHIFSKSVDPHWMLCSSRYRLISLRLCYVLILLSFSLPVSYQCFSSALN